MNGLDEETRRQCALVVQPYGYGGSSAGQPVTFEKASLAEAFAGCRVQWLDAIRNKGAFPFERGRVTYYAPFGGRWRYDEFGPEKSCASTFLRLRFRFTSVTRITAGCSASRPLRGSRTTQSSAAGRSSVYPPKFERSYMI